jgi:AraC family transcriptional regulator, transcriptional activator of pobA
MTLFPVLSIHQFDENGAEHELYVNTFAGHLRKHHADISLPHKHDFYLSVLFTRGTGMHEIDFRRYEVSPGAVFFLQPGQTHYWELSDDIEGIVFFHSAAFYGLHFPHGQLAEFPFFFSRQNEPYLKVAAEQLPDITDLYREMLAEFRSRLAFRYRKIASLMNCVYIDLSRIYEQTHPGRLGAVQRYAPTFSAFETLIEAHYRQEKSAGFYADRLNIGQKHLNRISRENSGKTSTEVILERVMLEAKRLLSAGGRNLNEIARELGYEEYAYFSRLFRRYCGESPRTFLKRYH